MIRRRDQDGQTILEYSIIMIIVIATLITMQGYMKRGFQGRWKSAVDDLGEQYDPRAVCSTIAYSQSSRSVASVRVRDYTSDDGISGKYTLRHDEVNSSETKTGTTEVRRP